MILAITNIVSRLMEVVMSQTVIGNFFFILQYQLLYSRAQDQAVTFVQTQLVSVGNQLSCPIHNLQIQLVSVWNCLY